jgi:hypothetical protein
MYVYSPSGTVGGQVTIPLDVAVAGMYEVWGRVQAEHTGGDSFWVSMDAGPEALWDLPIKGWSWAPVVDRDNPERAQLYHLSTGAHALLVRNRESGAKLDIVELRRFAPDVPLPQPSPTATPLQTPTRTATPVAACDPPTIAGPLTETVQYCDVPVTFTWTGNCAEYYFQFLYGGGVRSSGWITATQWGPLFVRDSAWRVKGRNGPQSESDWSPTRSLIVESRPTNVEARGVSCDQIQVTWQGGPCPWFDQYQACCGGHCATEWEKPPATVRGLESGTAYTCTVKGYSRRWGYWSVPSEVVTGTTLGPNLGQEAEDGVLVEPMAVGEDPQASHGQYIYSPVSYDGHATLHLCQAESGDFELRGRVSADGYGSDTFWITVDNGTEALWEIPVGPWTWDPVTHRDDSGQKQIQVYHLEAGSHYIHIRAREAGARLDVMQLWPAGQSWPTATATLAPSATPVPTSTPTPSATRTPTASPTLTGTPTPTPTASTTPTSTTTRTVTPTATPPGDLMLSGRVYDAALGPLQGVSGATVSAIMCMPRTFQTLSEADGSYSMLLSALYLNQCVTITLDARAAAYQTLSFSIPIADLRAQPMRDLALIPLPTPTATMTPVVIPTRFRVYMPIVIRRSSSGMQGAR